MISLAYKISHCLSANHHPELRCVICTGVTLFAPVLHLNCTALSQSESSNFVGIVSNIIRIVKNDHCSIFKRRNTIKIYQEDRNQTKTETNGTRVWIKTHDFLQQKVGFCSNCSSLVGYLAVVEGLLFLAVCRGGRCREVKIRVNVWTVSRTKKSGHCREVAVCGGCDCTITIIIAINNIEIKKSRTGHYPSSSIASVTAFVTHGQTFMTRLKS